MPSGMEQLKQRIRQAGQELGLFRLGFAAAAPLPHQAELRRWLDRGYAGEMTYLERSAGLRGDPRHLLPQAHTAIVAAVSYAPAAPAAPSPAGCALIARYARGADYHRVLHQRLGALAKRIAAITQHPLLSRVVVDTAPLLERELAAAAGLGFFGKNTLLITPGLGSYTVLGALLCDLELPPDPRLTKSCGSCQLCLAACPTGALRAPYLLEAPRCISYLTIEHRAAVAPELRDFGAPWVFGCDRCQEVCPHNARAAHLPLDPELVPLPAADLPLAELLDLHSGAYRRLVRGRALSRAPRRVWRRNAALACAAQPPGSCPAGLRQLLARTAVDPDPILAEAARWALQRL